MIEGAGEQESEKAGWEVDEGFSGHLLIGSAGAVSVLTPLGDGHAVATRYEHHPLVGVQPLHGLVAPYSLHRHTSDRFVSTRWRSAGSLGSRPGTPCSALAVLARPRRLNRRRHRRSEGGQGFPREKDWANKPRAVPRRTSHS
jgi:hypothetical protein